MKVTPTVKLKAAYRNQLLDVKCTIQWARRWVKFGINWWINGWVMNSVLFHINLNEACPLSFKNLFQGKIEAYSYSFYVFLFDWIVLHIFINVSKKPQTNVVHLLYCRFLFHCLRWQYWYVMSILYRWNRLFYFILWARSSWIKVKVWGDYAYKCMSIYNKYPPPLSH